MSTLGFSIVIPTYKRPESLSLVLRSLCQLTIPDGWRLDVIVVENGIRAGAEKIAADAARLGLTLRYMFEPGPGRARALNHGIRESTGESLCTLDDDIILPPGWLVEVTRALQKYPEGMVFGGPLQPQWHNGRRPQWFRDGIGVEFSMGDEDCEFPPNRNPLNGHRILRRVVFERYGLYREDRDIIGQERRLFAGEHYLFQIRQDGGKIYYLARAGGRHLMTREQATKAYYRRVAWRSGRGIAEVALSECVIRRSVVGVPLYVIRAAVADLRAYIATRLVRDAPKRFDRELQLLSRTGEMWSFVRNRSSCRLQSASNA